MSNDESPEAIEKILTDLRKAQEEIHSRKRLEIPPMPKKLEEIDPPKGSGALMTSNQPFPVFHSPEEAERGGFEVVKERDDDGG